MPGHHQRRLAGRDGGQQRIQPADTGVSSLGRGRVPRVGGGADGSRPGGVVRGGTWAGGAGLAAACLVGAGIEFLPPPVLVAVTSQRLLCWRLSRLRRTPRLLVFAVPLAELRIAKYLPGRYASSIQREMPGGRRIRLQARRAGRKDLPS